MKKRASYVSNAKICKLHRKLMDQGINMGILINTDGSVEFTPIGKEANVTGTPIPKNKPLF